MRLIDAPIGIFRFDGELVLKTEYYSKDKQSGKYIPDCYIIRTGEYFWGSAKTANELINLHIEPVDFAELLPTVTDTISRQAAIDEANAWLLDCLKVNKQDRSCGLIRRLEDLPSAQLGTNLAEVGTDCISRQQAIDALNKLSELTYEVNYGVVDCDDAINAIAALPPMEPKKGKWIKKHRHYGGFRSYTGFDVMGEQHTVTVDERTKYDDLYCSECGARSADNFLNFCPNCGADMRGEHNG